MDVGRSLLEDISDAEECLNDTYLTAWNLMPQGRPKFLSSFLLKIVSNISYNKFRFQNNSRRKRDISFSTEELEECIDGSNNVEEKFDEAQVVNAINEFLGTLKKDKRYIFVRRYWYLYGIADIAGHCSLTEENVTVILSRIRKQLKDHLKRRMGEE